MCSFDIDKLKQTGRTAVPIAIHVYIRQRKTRYGVTAHHVGGNFGCVSCNNESG